MAMLDVGHLLRVLLSYEGDQARLSEVMGRIVLDLLMEVEALRKTGRPSWSFPVEQTLWTGGWTFT
jgi:hypothetical protein